MIPIKSIRPHEPETTIMMWIVSTLKYSSSTKHWLISIFEINWTVKIFIVSNSLSTVKFSTKTIFIQIYILTITICTVDTSNVCVTHLWFSTVTNAKTFVTKISIWTSSAVCLQGMDASCIQEKRKITLNNVRIFHEIKLWYIHVHIMGVRTTLILSFSKQRGTSLQRAGLNFHTTISKQISIGSSKSMKFAYQTESQPIHRPIVISVCSMSISYRIYKTRGL